MSSGLCAFSIILFLLEISSSLVSASASFDVPSAEEKCEVQRRWVAGDPKVVDLESFPQRSESEKVKIAHEEELVLIVSRPPPSERNPSYYEEAINSLLESAPKLTSVRIFGGSIQELTSSTRPPPALEALKVLARVLRSKGKKLTSYDYTLWYLVDDLNQERFLEHLQNHSSDVERGNVSVTARLFPHRLTEVTVDNETFIYTTRSLAAPVGSLIDHVFWREMVASFNNRPLHQTPLWCDRKWMFAGDTNWTRFTRAIYPIEGRPPLTVAEFEDKILGKPTASSAPLPRIFNSQRSGATKRQS
ncbi:hypothetical protein M3Y99_01998900 [Aphelenchoides fujianensis]|nr:hypothetical protein M3Y99_01998900 [Aphelenchoides fujianensis]